jgi:hypothetical protein
VTIALLCGRELNKIYVNRLKKERNSLHKRKRRRLTGFLTSNAGASF